MRPQMYLIPIYNCRIVTIVLATQSQPAMLLKTNAASCRQYIAACETLDLDAREVTIVVPDAGHVLWCTDIEDDLLPL